MTSDTKPVEEEAAPAPEENPERRAFTGHPDHPPSSPDQPVEGNHELLRVAEEGGAD